MRAICPKHAGMIGVASCPDCTIESLRQQLAECERERDEYNTARLGLIADLDNMWDERHKAQKESNDFRNERDAIWHSYQDCRQQLVIMTAERDEARANERCAMTYLSEVRAIVGGDDFPDMVKRVAATLKERDELVSNSYQLGVCIKCGNPSQDPTKEHFVDATASEGVSPPEDSRPQRVEAPHHFSQPANMVGRIADILVEDHIALMSELATVTKERDELVAALTECRSSVKFDQNRYERMSIDYGRLGPEGEAKHAIAEAEATRLHKLIDTIDALAKLGAGKTGEV